MTETGTEGESAPPAPLAVVSLLTDYGLDDEMVGVLHSIIGQLAPGVRLVDVHHNLTPGDARSASLCLARAVQYLSPGVVLVSVDPRSGSERRSVAVSALGGRVVFVGPDSGVLAAAVGMVGGADRAVVLDNPTFRLESPGLLDVGRDVLAPVAGHLCAGVPFEEVGTAVDPASVLPGLLPVLQHIGEELRCEVLHVDRFGAVQLNLDGDDLDVLVSEGRLTLAVGEERRSARRVASPAELVVGEIGAINDPWGLLSLVAGGGSAAEMLGLEPGAEIGLLVEALRSGSEEVEATEVTLGPTRLTREEAHEPDERRNP